MTQGSFHRLESPTQTIQDAIDQCTSQEVWGAPARGSGIPSVKAYRGGMPAGRRGIEFRTPVAPTRGSGTPYEARWYAGTSGVQVRTKNGVQYAAIAASVVNLQP